MGHYKWGGASAEGRAEASFLSAGNGSPSLAFTGSGGVVSWTRWLTRLPDADPAEDSQQPPSSFDVGRGFQSPIPNARIVARFGTVSAVRDPFWHGLAR